MRINPILDIVKKQKQGIDVGIFSVCSSNKHVLGSCMRRAKKENSLLLIEPTSNQVNQFRGYSGMTPKEFVDYIKKISVDNNFDFNNIILGGDHLGPLPWSSDISVVAMEKSKELVRDFVLSGFTKIHIDTTIRLKDDEVLTDEIIANRGAILVKVAEEAFKQLRELDNSAVHPVYIIGSEVPTAGGVSSNNTKLNTDPESFKRTIKCFKDSFANENLNWEHVIGVVVHPGVEFTNDTVFNYDRKNNQELSLILKEYQDIVFEGHSTDYQSKESLKEMVEDGVAILKVGPALTFALRELLFSLTMLENEVVENDKSNFIETLDNVMIKKPKHWEKHYITDIENLRKYSLLDRSRYYMEEDEILKSINQLINNLFSSDISSGIVSQFLPNLEHPNWTFEDLVDAKISKTLDDYYYATSPNNLNKSMPTVLTGVENGNN